MTIRPWMAGALAAVALSGAASADDDAVLCGAYAAVGQVMAGEMLDVTMREYVGVANGTNTALLNQIGEKMLNAWDGKQTLAVAGLGEENSMLLGEAAGATAIGALMGGVSDDAAAIAAMMEAQCLDIGITAILANQEASRAAAAGNAVGQ